MPVPGLMAWPWLELDMSEVNRDNFARQITASREQQRDAGSGQRIVHRSKLTELIEFGRYR
jgi:hypothetical protein